MRYLTGKLLVFISNTVTVFLIGSYPGYTCLVAMIVFKLFRILNSLPLLFGKAFQ